MKTATAYFWLSSPFVETTIDDRECDSEWFFEQDDKEQKRNIRGGSNLMLLTILSHSATEERIS